MCSVHILFLTVAAMGVQGPSGALWEGDTGLLILPFPLSHQGGVSAAGHGSRTRALPLQAVGRRLHAGHAAVAGQCLHRF